VNAFAKLGIESALVLGPQGQPEPLQVGATRRGTSPARRGAPTSTTSCAPDAAPDQDAAAALQGCWRDRFENHQAPARHEKLDRMRDRENKFAFRDRPPRPTRPRSKQAVEQLFKVKVLDVKTSIGARQFAASAVPRAAAQMEEGDRDAEEAGTRSSSSRGSRRWRSRATSRPARDAA